MASPLRFIALGAALVLGACAGDPINTPDPIEAAPATSTSTSPSVDVARAPAVRIAGFLAAVERDPALDHLTKESALGQAENICKALNREGKTVSQAASEFLQASRTSEDYRMSAAASALIRLAAESFCPWHL